MGNLVQGYYRISVWITRLAYVNILWVLFTIVGLGVLGIMPSTAAMFAVTRKWVDGEHDIPVFQTFWQSFKDEFISANIFGYVILIIGYILYIDLQFLRTQEGFLNMLSYGVLVLFFGYFIILLYAFPVFVHFKLSIINYVKWSFIIGFIHPFMTIIMAVGTGLALFIIYKQFVGLSLFFSGSVIAFVLMWGASKTFVKIEPKAPENDKG